MHHGRLKLCTRVHVEGFQLFRKRVGRCTRIVKPLVSARSLEVSVPSQGTNKKGANADLQQASQAWTCT